MSFFLHALSSTSVMMREKTAKKTEVKDERKQLGRGWGRYGRGGGVVRMVDV